MGRLTKRYIGGIANNEAGISCSNYCDNCEKADCKIVQKMIRKLAEYEDAEEQGMLIKIPVKIGDTVYEIPSPLNYKLNIIKKNSKSNRVYCWLVTGLEMKSKEDIYLEADYGKDFLLLENFGTYWFLKKEEAEQKLKEIKEWLGEEMK